MLIDTLQFMSYNIDREYFSWLVSPTTTKWAMNFK
nr:MAG TPA: hypothetical protein [Caudoviricetes sp.]